MNSIAKNLVVVLVVLVIAIVLSLIAGCTVAAIAHYRLGWSEDRANDIGNLICTIVFIGGLGAFKARK